MGDPDWSETYKARAGENLASAQYLLLRRFIRVLVVGEVEAWCAACVLALLQRRRVPFVHALQGATTHTPVEVVHALPLQDNQNNSSEITVHTIEGSGANYTQQGDKAQDKHIMYKNILQQKKHVNT